MDFAKPKEGYFTWFCGLTLLNVGEADQAMAYDFIDAWLSPETGKALIEGRAMATPTARASMWPIRSRSRIWGSSPTRPST